MLNRQYSIVKAACKQSATPLLGFTSHSPGVAYELRPVGSIRTQIRFLDLLHARWVSPTSYALSAPSARYPDLFASLTSSPLTKQFTGLFCSAECKSATLAFLFQIQTMNLQIRHHEFLKLPAPEAAQLKVV